MSNTKEIRDYLNELKITKKTLDMKFFDDQGVHFHYRAFIHGLYEITVSGDNVEHRLFQSGDYPNVIEMFEAVKIYVLDQLGAPLPDYYESSEVSGTEIIAQFDRFAREVQDRAKQKLFVDSFTSLGGEGKARYGRQDEHRVEIGNKDESKQYESKEGTMDAAFAYTKGKLKEFLGLDKFSGEVELNGYEDVDLSGIGGADDE